MGRSARSRREESEAAYAEFKSISFEQAWTPTPRALQENAKELFELPVLFFRKSGRIPKAGNVGLISFKRFDISLHEAFRKFLAEAQRPIYVGVKEIVTFCEAPQNPSSFMGYG